MPTPHNPDNLTPEQIETHLGYRLLNEDEIENGPQIEEIQMYDNRAQCWIDNVMGSDKICTYRTKLTPLELFCKRTSRPLPTAPWRPEVKFTQVFLPTWLIYLLTFGIAAPILLLIYLIFSK